MSEWLLFLFFSTEVMFLRCEIDTRIVKHEFAFFLFPKYSLFVTGTNQQNWKKIICSPDLSILVCLISTLNLAGGGEGADKEGLLGLMKEKYVHLFPFEWREAPFFEIIGMWHFPEPWDHIHWRIVHPMAATDPKSLIQVLSVGVERDKELPRTIRHLAKARGMHLLQYGWNWGFEDHLGYLKPNSHGQSTNLLASENPSFFGHVHHSEPHSSLCSGNGRGEECGSSWQSEEGFALCSCGEKCPWTLQQARKHHNDSIWHRNSGWILWCGEENHGGLLRWTRPLNCLFPGKPFQEHHGLILLPEMWGHKCESNPFQCPHCSHRLELEKEKHQAPNTGTHSLVRKYLQGSRFTGSKMRGILSISFPPDCGECNIFLPLLCQSKQKISDQKELDTNGVWHIFFKEQGEELLLNTNPAVPLGNKK